ncbi:hypothetical protein RB595_005166 [Gaeumannomyces hyphopodioides]
MAPIYPEGLHAGGIIMLAVALFPLYVVGKIVYNLFLHPLRSFPGPLLHRATVVPYCAKLAGGTLPYDVAAMHEKYGPVVRISPDFLSFIDAEAWRDIYGHRTGSLQGQEEMAKASMFYDTRGIPKSLINESREKHTVLRRQLAHGFSDRSMRLQEPIIGSYVDLLIRRLHEHCYEFSDDKTKKHKVLDLSRIFNYTTFDIISDLAFGEPLGCLENFDDDPWIVSMNAMVRVFGPIQALKHLGFEWVVAAILKLGLSRSRQAHMNKTKAKLQRRMNLSMERPDLIEGLLRVKSLDFEQIRLNAGTLMVAGSETTATLLAGVVYLLLTHPDKMARLVEEVRSSFQAESEITLTSVSSLAYMLACLDEALRRYPPVAIGMPRTVPAGGATVAGVHVPENANVAVWQQACYQSSRNFEDPLAYKPERWINRDEKSRDRLDAVQPFHIGPRNCIGKNLAYSEMRLILARLLYSFDLELVDKDKDWFDQKCYVLRDKPALNVYLTPVSR